MRTKLQLMLSQWKGFGWASALSLTLHCVVAWSILQAPASWLTVSRPTVEPVAFEIVAPEPSRAPDPAPSPTEPAPRPEPTDVAPAPPDPPRQRRPESAEPAVATAPEAPTSAPVSTIEVPDVTPTEPPPGLRPDPRSETMRVLLDPTNVARGGFVATGPGPSRRGAPAGLPSGRPGLRSEAEIERSLASGLRAEAMTKAHITREPVRPRRQADGSYLWNGPMFAARIQPSGEVQFEDASDINTNGISASGSFDLEGALMSAAGQDPRAAERARFMRETRALREQLEDAYRARERQRAARTMRGRLTRTWARVDRSEASRRRRIFTLWDETAEDGSMDEVRQAILDFVRETLPAGSEFAYTEDELVRLNARRESRERFQPY